MRSHFQVSSYSYTYMYSIILSTVVHAGWNSGAYETDLYCLLERKCNVYVRVCEKE